MKPAEMRALFLLDPQVAFLNHGSFGACPAPVFAAYQNWQRELERQPVEFLGRRAAPLLAEARAQLAAYVGAAANDVVFFSKPDNRHEHGGAQPGTAKRGRNINH